MIYYLSIFFTTLFSFNHALPKNTNDLNPKTYVMMDQKLGTEQLKQQYATYKLYKKQYNKPEANGDLEYRRFTMYLENVMKIHQHNERYERGEETFEMGINQFTDLLPEELAKLNGYRFDMKDVIHAGDVLNVTVPESLPEYFNWRDLGAVTPVKNQGLSCSSCWTFSATGALEGQHFINTFELVSLSEQNLLDCSGKKYGNYGCNGGQPLYAYQYVIDNNGIDTEVSYPYEEKVSECRYQTKTRGTTCIKSFIVAQDDEKKLQAAIVQYGPISIAVDATGLTSYKQGIYGPWWCTTKPNHAVLAVGYGTEEKILPNGTKTHADYWIIKNSWGKDWGENGYYRLARNQNNMCGVASLPTLPVVPES